MKKVHITSLGCAKNLVDSEVLGGQLKHRNYDLVENPENADVIIVNTCGFIEDAKSVKYDLRATNYNDLIRLKDTANPLILLLLSISKSAFQISCKTTVESLPPLKPTIQGLVLFSSCKY